MPDKQGRFVKGERPSKETEFKKGAFAREKHPFWKGGRYKNTAGYVFILSPNHPHANCDGYVREHRLIIEKTIGRILSPEEKVHHINRVHDDNRIENLVLFASNAEHMRQHRTGRWSRKYDLCVVCEDNKRPYEARGMCDRCYKNWQYHKEER